VFRRRGAQKRSAPDDDIFHVLRSQALNLSHPAIGLSPNAELPHVFGVVMDTTYSSGTATLVVVADGTTSLYTSTGGGVLGGGAHEQVAAASGELLRVAEGQLDTFSEQRASPLPAVGHVQITVLTYSGLRGVDAAEDDLGYQRHPAAPVFHAAHEVIAALRLVESSEPPTPGA
jgi:hypothetical protein